MNPVYVLFAVLGSLLLGLGVILIFANNWANIPKNIKVGISFIPLLAAMCMFIFTLLKRRDSAAFREGSALGLCLSIFATIALIGQVFQIPSDLDAYLRLCMALSLPAIYLLGASSAATLYVACAIWSGAYSDFPYWGALLSVVAFAPFLIMRVKKAEQKTIAWYLSILSGALLAFLIFKLPGDLVAISIKFLTCSIVLLALVAFIKRMKKFDKFIPLTPLSSLTVIVVLALSSFQNLKLYSVLDDPGSLIALACAVVLYAAVRFYAQHFEVKAEDVIVLCAALGSPLFWLWSNVLLAVLGVWQIIAGVRSLKIKLVNYGMLLLIFVIIARFFDSDLGLMERGIAFVVIGAGFFLTNLLLHRKWRSV